MRKDEYQTMADMEDTYWWHIGRKSILAGQLSGLCVGRPRILNIGCGTGGLIPLLERFGDVTNVDASGEAVRLCREKGFQQVQVVPSGVLPFADKSFDMVVATDVLEHIEDDVGALQEWRRVLKTGGVMLITVPAYQWLWSAHDEALQHYRRYSISQLHQLVNRAGCRVNKRSYIIVFSFPLIVGYRFVASLFNARRPSAHLETRSSYVILPACINRLFVLLLQVEAVLVKYINFPFGTSILVAATRYDR